MGHVDKASAVRLLVVEDDPEINQLVGAYAQLAGFEYRSALNGGDAIDEVNRRPPSVVVLDLMLPDLDGLEVCRRLKRSAAAARVPVIILTALDRESKRQESLQCGAVDYLTKPFDPDHLMQVITEQADEH